MAIPLSEILSARGDADYAQGGYGASTEALNNAATQSYLQHYTDQQVAANRYLMAQHDENLKNTLNNLDNVDFKGLLPSDNAALMQQYGDVLKNTTSNFSTVRNPLSNPQQYAALKLGEANFRRNLSQSQQDAAYLAQQQKFVEQHPEYNTPEYKQNVEQFLAQPVGQRKYFTVTPPQIFNPEALGKTFGELAKKKYATSSTDGKYITTEDGEKIDQDKYLKLWANPGQDQFGRQIESTIQRAYADLPPNLKSLYKDYTDFKYQMALHNMPEDQVTKKTMNEDQFATIKAQGAQTRQTQAAQQAFQAGQNDKDRAIEWAKIDQAGNGILKKGQIDKNAVGQYKNNIFYNIATEGYGDNTAPNEMLQNLYGNNNDIKVHKVDDEGNAITVKSPTISIVNHYIENGKLVLERLDNATGKHLPRLHVPLTKLYNDLDNLKGPENAPTINSASREWLKKQTGSETPDITKLQQIFNPDKSYNYNGKTYTTGDLKKLGYSDDQISQYINQGILK